MSKLTNNYGKNMLLYTSNWGDMKTFKLMPADKDCPYDEVIYDPSTKLLVVITKNKKDNFQFVPRLTQDGDPIPKKKRIAGDNEPYQQQRVMMNLSQEHYIIDEEEQKSFIDSFAVNSDSYDYGSIMNPSPIINPNSNKVLDASGNPVSSKKIKEKV